ncbi:MAG: 4Fe-4S binding protein [Bradymonadales bacterium]|nr:4Fe-4S binding protein [Bradymonadales bacterium]
MLTPDSIVSTIPERCKRCYTCVRECPAQAIKVEGGQAMVIQSRCIACGNCVKVCAQNAKRIQDGIGPVRHLLAERERVFACIAPSFPAAFHPLCPGKLVAAVRALGFFEVWEVAFGAELISPIYARAYARARREARQVISTACPAIVSYVEKYMPQLHHALAPIPSPMIATARAIRHRHGKEVGVVFIGPCIAKKNEIRDPALVGEVDAVLTYEELVNMFHQDGIVPEQMDESGFDGPRCLVGRAFALSGGLSKTAGIDVDILENDIHVADGKDRVLAVLQEAASGDCRVRLLDLLFCEGCINGPKMITNASVFARKNILASVVNRWNRQTTQREMAESLAEFADLDLTRSFIPQVVELHRPTEEQIEQVLRSLRKYTPEDQLNCGACGYRTCREKAIAVCQGLAEREMCLPYLVDELESSVRELRRSHKELASAQERLVHTEKLASMGQLSAGVAHEINNPLGTVLLYSHMLLRQLQQSDPMRDDLSMIVSEAARCRDIVRGLLDFARQSRVSKEPTDIAKLVHDVLALMSVRVGGTDIQLISDLQDDLPLMMLDASQIKQVLVNLVGNSIDAVGESGQIKLSAQLSESRDRLVLKVSDNGCGIAKENLAKLFTPFFTTKSEGKGTGLGLAVAYGIVKMHHGDIWADSEPGKGTTFTLIIPLSTSDQSQGAETL